MKISLLHFIILGLVTVQTPALLAQDKGHKSDKQAQSKTKPVKQVKKVRDPFINTHPTEVQVQQAPAESAESTKIISEAPIHKAAPAAPQKKYAVVTDGHGNLTNHKIQIKVVKNQVTDVIFPTGSRPVIRKAGHAPYIVQGSGSGEYHYFMLQQQIAEDGSKYIAMIPTRNIPKLHARTEIQPESLDQTIRQLQELNGVQETTQMGEQPESHEDTIDSDEPRSNELKFEESMEAGEEYGDESYYEEESYETSGSQI